MKYYTCDNCEVKLPIIAVVLKGVTGTSGSILQPEEFRERHFCTPKCFWLWVDKCKPKEGL